MTGRHLVFARAKQRSGRYPYWELRQQEPSKKQSCGSKQEQAPGAAGGDDPGLKAMTEIVVGAEEQHATGVRQTRRRRACPVVVAADDRGGNRADPRPEPVARENLIAADAVIGPLILFCYMTGWRIAAILSLRREDLDLDGGTAFSRAEDNKGRRDQKVPLHPLLLERLRKLAGFGRLLFPWNRARRLLFEEFARIQKKGGIKLKGPRDHYGFHDLRRGFATMNADRLTPDALQFLMQHKDYKTTQRYINLARQMNPTMQNLYVPELPKAGRR
jgi:integrase